MVITNGSDFKYTHTNDHLVGFLNKWKVQDYVYKMPSVFPGNFEAITFRWLKEEAVFRTGHGDWTLLITGLSSLGIICFYPVLVFLMRGMSLSHPAAVAFLSSMMQWLSFGKEYSSSDIIVVMDITHGMLSSPARHILYPLYHWSQQ